RAGYSLLQGVEAVAQEIDEPMGGELRRVLAEARLGRLLEDSLEDMAERLNSRDFAWAVMAIRIQREVGGNLAELLSTVGETMIARERLRREVRSLTAEGRISAIILGILPIALGGVMYAVNPEYIQVLFKHTSGHIMLAGAGLLALVGFYWMKKTIETEEKATIRASLRQLGTYEVENVRDTELLTPFRERALAPFLRRITDLGRRLTPVESARRKLILSGRASPDALDRFLAMRVLFL